MSAVLQAAVVGATGYAGIELVRLLSQHPRAKPPLLFGRPEHPAHAGLKSSTPVVSTTEAAQPDVLHPFDFGQLKHSGVDVLFLSTPHEQSRRWVPQALELGVRVVDLSGAWRLQCVEHRAVYRFDDEGSGEAERVQRHAVYGLPELHRHRISSASLVANPGCYATSIILALAPMVKAGLVNMDRGIICDAKSGVSGAGKAATSTTHFMNVAENLSVYGAYAHRHTGELIEQLGVPVEQITFTPHLLPIQRGILTTTYCTLNETVNGAELAECYREFYGHSPMVRVHAPPMLPQIQHSARTNFCDIGFAVSPERRRVTIVSSLDNLLKGAAAQAVQNMNLMFGFSEDEGLR